MNTLSVIISILGIIGLEISPIPFNPLKLLGKGVSYCLGITEIGRKIDKLEKTVDQNDIDTIRSRIVAFDNLVRLDMAHNQICRYQYNAIFKDITKWRGYHKKYPELNGEIDAAIDNIEDSFKKAKFLETRG